MGVFIANAGTALARSNSLGVNVMPATATAKENPIKITDTAAKEIRRLMRDNHKEGWALRLGVQAGGCSGMEYAMDFAETPGDSDHIFEENGVKVFVDLKSYLYLHGLQLDFKEALIGGGFKFGNPNAARTCSCGTSFSA
jgi:iron-sulfur cluster assembly protein